MATRTAPKFDSQIETEAYEAGRKARGVIARGDMSLGLAWETSDVGYPYLSASDAPKALAAFKRGVGTVRRPFQCAND